MGMLGCWADGVHPQCRYCGDSPYTSVECPSSVGGQKPTWGDASATECTFANEPTIPYYWDATCTRGQLGCLADGVHPECRFCEARPFESIPCPSSVAPPAKRCTFPAEPATLYYWDENCTMGE